MRKNKKIQKPKGKHFSKGKPPVHLIPSEAIIAMARGFEYGANKYGEYNFREGIKWTEITSSLNRHYLAFMQGIDIDEESGLPHVYLIGANFAMLTYMIEHFPELDNRFGSKKIKKNKPKKTKKHGPRRSSSGHIYPIR